MARPWEQPYPNASSPHHVMLFRPTSHRAKAYRYLKSTAISGKLGNTGNDNNSKVRVLHPWRRHQMRQFALQTAWSSHLSAQPLPIMSIFLKIVNFLHTLRRMIHQIANSTCRIHKRPSTRASLWFQLELGPNRPLPCCYSQHMPAAFHPLQVVRG